MIAAGCSGDDSGTLDSTTTSTVATGPTAVAETPDGAGQPLRVESMAAAVGAVETALGGPQRFYEVNATPSVVNVFVAGADGAATAYVYDAAADSLGEPDAPQPASGNTFTWTAVDFDPETVLTDALGQLPDALPRTFAVTAASADAVLYQVTLESAQGGVLDVQVDQDGKVLGAAARD